MRCQQGPAPCGRSFIILPDFTVALRRWNSGPRSPFMADRGARRRRVIVTMRWEWAAGGEVECRLTDIRPN